MIALNRGSGNVSTFIASPNSGYNAHSTALAGINPISIALGRHINVPLKKPIACGLFDSKTKLRSRTRSSQA